MCLHLLHFPDSSVGKESTYNAGDPSSIPGLGRSPGEGKGYLLQYSGLENSMDCIVHGVAKIRTRLSELTDPGKRRRLLWLECAGQWGKLQSQGKELS